MVRRIGIAGGGAAGMMAALAARAEGAEAVIYERNKRLGIKILISGGGKCNITHDAAPLELEQGFVPREGRFLRHAFHEFTPDDLLNILHAEGLATVTRPNGRVFPASGRAEDVLSTFERMLDRAGAIVRLDTHVEGIEIADGRNLGLRVGGATCPYDAVIVTTGGMSYRKVGTTGDGINWGAVSGHEVERVRAALAPIYVPAPPPAEWQGVALRDIRCRLERADGTVPTFARPVAYPTEWRGDLLLTHRGVSGPVVLEISRAAARLREEGERPQICVDVVPDLTLEDLRERWEERANAAGRSEVQTFVESFVPRALVPFLLRDAGVPIGCRLSDTTRAQRSALLGVLKRWSPGDVGEVPIDRGEVTAGGIALDAVSRTTMASRLADGLYFAGEVLDVAGCVGGYNLQAAFSTGFVAGRAAARGRR